jgi:hypothetical protein
MHLVTLSLLLYNEEPSVMGEPNSHSELDQPQDWKDVTDESVGSFQENVNMNVNSEVS